MYRQNAHGILLQNNSTGLGLFWDDFPHKKFGWDLDTHFPSNVGFWEKKFFAKPLSA